MKYDTLQYNAICYVAMQLNYFEFLSVTETAPTSTAKTTTRAKFQSTTEKSANEVKDPTTSTKRTASKKDVYTKKNPENDCKFRKLFTMLRCRTLYVRSTADKNCKDLVNPFHVLCGLKV